MLHYYNYRAIIIRHKNVYTVLMDVQLVQKLLRSAAFRRQRLHRHELGPTALLHPVFARDIQLHKLEGFFDNLLDTYVRSDSRGNSEHLWLMTLNFVCRSIKLTSTQISFPSASMLRTVISFAVLHQDSQSVCHLACSLLARVRHLSTLLSDVHILTEIGLIHFQSWLFSAQSHIKRDDQWSSVKSLLDDCHVVSCNRGNHAILDHIVDVLAHDLTVHMAHQSTGVGKEKGELSSPVVHNLLAATASDRDCRVVELCDMYAKIISIHIADENFRLLAIKSCVTRLMSVVWQYMGWQSGLAGRKVVIEAVISALRDSATEITDNILLSLANASPSAFAVDLIYALLSGESRLHVACRRGDTSKIVEILSKSHLARKSELAATLNAVDNSGYSALHEACVASREEAVAALIEHSHGLLDVAQCGGPNKDLTALEEAVLNNQSCIVRSLLVYAGKLPNGPEVLHELLHIIPTVETNTSLVRMTSDPSKVSQEMAELVGEFTASLNQATTQPMTSSLEVYVVCSAISRYVGQSGLHCARLALQSSRVAKCLAGQCDDKDDDSLRLDVSQAYSDLRTLDTMHHMTVDNDLSCSFIHCLTARKVVNKNQN